jgi:glycogen phosphorylase
MLIYPKNINPVVYLCSEFAIDSDLPTYVGGLGVLAGDLMKEAADQDFPMIGIGLLYRGKTFVQHITSQGKEEKRDSQFDHDTSFLRKTAIKGKPLEVELEFRDLKIKVRSYHVRLSEKTIMIFLSTNVDNNPQEWIDDMDAVYRGDTDSQIRQQLVLGIGGAKILKALGIKPSIYHLNEGRPGFVAIELLADIVSKKGISTMDALLEVKKKIVYTNHTLVPAGNLEYPLDKVNSWIASYCDQKGIDHIKLTSLGIKDGNFSITKFAINISSIQNGVSKFHTKEAKKYWPGNNFVPITNGVHMISWQDSDFRNPSISDRHIWDLHMIKKRELARTVLERTGFSYNPNMLVVSWARRLATYKQPLEIFKDLEKLKQVVSVFEKPVQILFSGNSHGSDPNAKGIIEKIISIMSGDLAGHAIFIPNYNTSLANHLVSGSDVWLNTPEGNQEASGTSGMKAASNGVINCTVLDGWTMEVNWEGIGWVLDEQRVGESFYELLENEMIHEYYERDTNGLPAKWLSKMRKSIELSKKYSTKRVLDDYKKILYGMKD